MRMTRQFDPFRGTLDIDHRSTKYSSGRTTARDRDRFQAHVERGGGRPVRAPRAGSLEELDACDDEDDSNSEKEVKL